MISVDDEVEQLCKVARMKLETEHIKEFERRMCTTWQESLSMQILQLTANQSQDKRISVDDEVEQLCKVARMKLETEHIKEFERRMCTTWIGYFQPRPVDQRKFYLSPKVDNKLEAKHKPIQMEPDSGLARNKAPPNTMLETKQPDVTIMPTMLFAITYFLRPSDVMPKFLESESPEPGTIHKYNHGSRKRSYSGPFNTSTNKKTSGSITTNPRPGEKGFVLHSADAKGNRVIKNISVITRASNGGSSSEGTGSTLTGGNNRHSSNDMPLIILDNQAQVNCTGVFSVLSNLSIGTENIVLIAANGGEMETFMSGSVHLGNFELPNVHYCPDLGDILIVSGSMLDNDDYGYEFRQGKFTVKDLKNDTTVGEGHLVDGNYILEYLKISGDRSRVPQQPGLVTTVWNAVCSALHRLGLKY